MKFLAYVLLLVGCQALTIDSENCTVKKEISDTIADYINDIREENCWIIKVPKKNFITLEIKSLIFESEGHNGLEIIEIRTGNNYTFDSRWYRRQKLVFGSDVKIIHYARNSITFWWSRFTLAYQIRKGFPMVGTEGSLSEGISWLKDQRSISLGWKENTPRAVVALFLASAVNFNGSVFEEELMATQVELKTSVSLLKSSNMDNELSLLVNSLLVTCYNPRKFHGIDIVKRLKQQIEGTRNFTHPVAYLALCNANETWPTKAFKDLRSILNNTSEYPLIKDMQAMAVMALSCFRNRNESYRFENESIDQYLYENTINYFKTLQLEDGSFGNVYTTSLVAQALISDGKRDWNTDATAEYLMRKLNTSINFLTTYLALPVLNGKSLVDISNINCSAHPRKHGDDILDEIREDLGPRMQVRYSLFIGDQKDVINTIFLRVPQGFTAYQIMEFAEIQNPKYKFERKSIAGKVNVYEIADLPNDPEVGKYWLMYVSSGNKTESLSHSFKSPNELILENGQHLVMWYKSLHF